MPWAGCRWQGAGIILRGAGCGDHFAGCVVLLCCCQGEKGVLTAVRRVRGGSRVRCPPRPPQRARRSNQTAARTPPRRTLHATTLHAARCTLHTARRHTAHARCAAARRHTAHWRTHGAMQDATRRHAAHTALHEAFSVQCDKCTARHIKRHTGHCVAFRVTWSTCEVEPAAP